MKTNNPSRNLFKRLTLWALLVASILTIPLLGNWPWTGSDFVFGAVLLFGSATTYELLTQNLKDQNQRLLVGLGVFFVLAFIWVGAATGFGSGE